MRADTEVLLVGFVDAVVVALTASLLDAGVETVRACSLRDVRRLADVVVLFAPNAVDLVNWVGASRSASQPAVLLVVAMDEESQLLAFRAGADDCLETPRSHDAIVERIIANARRQRACTPSGAPASRSIRTRSGTLAVSLAPTVALDGVPLDLPRVQAKLLRKLVESGQPVSGAELATAAWPDAAVSAHTLHTQMALLRARLRPLDLWVEHVRGSGYVLTRRHSQVC